MTDTADAPLTYTVKNVTAKTEVSATLIERPTYTITVTSEGSGTASAEPASVKRGGSTTITAVPSSNSYYLKEWSVNGGAAQAASGNTLALTEIRRIPQSRPYLTRDQLRCNPGCSGCRYWHNGCCSGKRQGHYAAEEQSGKCYPRQQGCIYGNACRRKRTKQADGRTVDGKRCRSE